MKKSLLATLIAAPVLTLSSAAFAAEPVQLSADQMDTVTAGYYNNHAFLAQFNASPVTVAQLNILSYDSYNTAYIASGNFSYLSQNTPSLITGL